MLDYSKNTATPLPTQYWTAYVNDEGSTAINYANVDTLDAFATAVASMRLVVGAFFAGALNLVGALWKSGTDSIFAGLTFDGANVVATDAYQDTATGATNSTATNATGLFRRSTNPNGGYEQSIDPIIRTAYHTDNGADRRSIVEADATLLSNMVQKISDSSYMANIQQYQIWEVKANGLRMFAIEDDGTIQVAQYTAVPPVGAAIGRLPIHDTTGALIGNLAVYI